MKKFENKISFDLIGCNYSNLSDSAQNLLSLAYSQMFEDIYQAFYSLHRKLSEGEKIWFGDSDFYVESLKNGLYIRSEFSEWKAVLCFLGNHGPHSFFIYGAYDNKGEKVSAKIDLAKNLANFPVGEMAAFYELEKLVTEPSDADFSAAVIDFKSTVKKMYLYFHKIDFGISIFADLKVALEEINSQEEYLNSANQ